MKKLIIAVLAAGIGLAAYAQRPGVQRTNIKNHPRVNQVNKRIDNQEKRIIEERKEGDLTHKEAREARKDLAAINQEKRQMRKANNGHLTKKDQVILNKQLNENSKKIGN